MPSSPTRGSDAPRRRGLIAAAGLAVLVASYLWPAAFAGRAFYMMDAQAYFYPVRLHLRERLLSGDLPLWIPHLDLGMPFLANPANGALYPLNLVLLLTPPACVGQFLVAHLVLAAVGTFVLLRVLGMRELPAAAGGAGTAFSGYFLSMTWSGVYLLSISWMPLVIALAIRLGRRSRALDVALFSAAGSSQILTGEMQGVMLTAGLGFAMLLADRETRGRRLRALAAVAASSLIPVVIALPQILPAMDLLDASPRAEGLGMEEIAHWSLHPLEIVGTAIPWLLGDPMTDAPYLGFFMHDEGKGLLRPPWMLASYAGSLALILAMVGIVRHDRAHRPWVIAACIAGVVAILIALGRHTPVLGAYLAAVPGASLFRYPAKVFPVVALVVPLLASAGLDALGAAVERRERRLPAALLAAAALAAAALAAAACLAPHAARMLVSLRPAVGLEAATSVLRTAMAREAISIALVASATGVAWRLKPSITPWVAACAMVLQIAVGNIGVARTTDPGIYLDRPPLADLVAASAPQGETPRILEPPDEYSPATAYERTPEDRARLRTWVLEKNIGIIFGIGYPDVYSSASRRDRQDFWASTGDFRKQTLDLFSVRWALVPPGIEVDEGIGMTPIDGFEGTGLKLFRNDRALPGCYPVRYATGAAGPKEALAAIRSPAVVLGRTAVIEGAAGPTETDANGAPGPGDPGTCGMSRPDGDGIDVACDLERDAWVVVSESHDRGWRATLDGGGPLEIRRANALVMAVRMPSGRHTASLEYRERTLPAALALSIAAMVGLGAALVLARVRMRRGP